MPGGVPISGCQPSRAELKSKLMPHEIVSGGPGKEKFTLIVAFAPGAGAGRHIHPGDEYAAVVDGELQINVDGQAPRVVKTGDTYHNAADVMHEIKNIGTVRARMIATPVVEQGEPLSGPVR